LRHSNKLIGCLIGFDGRRLLTSRRFFISVRLACAVHRAPKIEHANKLVPSGAKNW
jgi:hypothetical protein